MTNITNISESRKAVAAEIAQSFYGINSNSIINIVKKFVRKAVREQDMPYCTTVTESFSAGADGADRYRIKIIGGYNEMIRGGEEKTDRCFADITIYMMQNNRYDYTYAHIMVDERGIAVATYAAHIIEAINVAYLEQAEIESSYNHWTADALRDAEHAVMSDIVDDAQTDVDSYMRDLEWYDYNDFENKMEVYTAMAILKKIKQVSDDCLERVGDACGCAMVWEDGYHVDLSEIGKWYGGVSCSDMDDRDLENIIDTLDSMTSMDYDLPLADEDTLKEVENCGEIIWWGICVPLYVYEEVNGYVSTYYHYAYCA